MSHLPVMLREVLAMLTPKAGGVYVDGTFGAGGYSEAILKAADCRVIALDQDASASPRAEELKNQYGKRFEFFHARFSDAAQCLEKAGVQKVDGFVLDLGVSSMQLDQPERGFSFRFDGPLDMRMNQSEGQTAADIVNTWAEKDLAHVIYVYGDERHSRRIARAIVGRRHVKPFLTTSDLATLVRTCLPHSKKDTIDPATRTFQALRIAVNDELGELERALDVSEHILNPGGRLVVVTFHSLEDGLVKTYLRNRAGAAPGGSRHLPRVQTASAIFSILTKKALAPQDDEVAANPRARSAKLRAAERLAA